MCCDTLLLIYGFSPLTRPIMRRPTSSFETGRSTQPMVLAGQPVSRKRSLRASRTRKNPGADLPLHVRRPARRPMERAGERDSSQALDTIHTVAARRHPPQLLTTIAPALAGLR